MPKLLNQKIIDEYRRTKWQLKPALRIKSETDAVKFINSVGMSLLFACRDIPLPKMSQSAQSDEWDWWEWKDTLQAKKKWFNSRVVKKKATLVSMQLLPCFLSLYYESGGCEVYEEEYYYGKLTEPAYRIADYLFNKGPTSVDELRNTLASPGKKGTRRFHDALKELQTKFKIAVCGLEDKHWGVRVLDLFSQWAPKVVLKQTESIKPELARQQILQTFISTAGITTEKEVIRLFGWSPESVHETLQYLINSNLIHIRMMKQKKDIFYTVL